MASDTPALSSVASVNGAVVMADISGSTPLYERAGNEAAAAAINARIALMRDAVARYEGTFVSAKGDDVLCSVLDVLDQDDVIRFLKVLSQFLPGTHITQTQSSSPSF